MFDANGLLLQPLLLPAVTINYLSSAGLPHQAGSQEGLSLMVNRKTLPHLAGSLFPSLECMGLEGERQDLGSHVGVGSLPTHLHSVGPRYLESTPGL